ncbi:MAG: small basic protein [Candidatus Omnitrophica bacterium]|nr:small basic protein [Candidatus Omnitrophota bacterium]
MSQHPSLRSGEKSAKFRSVMKRYERIKKLKEKEKWAEGDSVYGLPKLKILKFKVKKEKAAPAAEGEVAAVEGAVPGAPQAGAASAVGSGKPQGAKSQAGAPAAKGVSPKKEEKKK